MRVYTATKKKMQKSDDSGETVKKMHMDGITLTVRMQSFVFDRGGVSDIPHTIMLAMARSCDWMDRAIDQVKEENFRKETRVAKAYSFVYRDKEFYSANKTGSTTFNFKNATAAVLNKLKTIRSGMAMSQVIKIMNKKREENHVSGRTHYLGLVKKYKNSNKVLVSGHIELGYEAFRVKTCLERVLIHEAAHKYTMADDGTNCGGYWNDDYYDYLDPSVMDNYACLKNADSHAMFVWALNKGFKDVPAIPKRFETEIENYWTKGGN